MSNNIINFKTLLDKRFSGVCKNLTEMKVHYTDEPYVTFSDLKLSIPKTYKVNIYCSPDDELLLTENLFCLDYQNLISINKNIDIAFLKIYEELEKDAVIAKSYSSLDNKNLYVRDDFEYYTYDTYNKDHKAMSSHFVIKIRIGMYTNIDKYSSDNRINKFSINLND